MLTKEQWNLLLDIETYFDVISLPQLPGLWLDGFNSQRVSRLYEVHTVGYDILWPVDEEVLAELVELGYVMGSDEVGYSITADGMRVLGI
jgi:hypothetical protein